MIRARRLTFGYGRPLIADLDLDVARGELVGILGANGAGKSTLARLLLGLLPPAAGQVSIDDHDLASLPPALRSRFFDMGWAERPGGVSVGARLGAARRVAELHGGKVQLSTSEHGCALTLTVPKASTV
jgi:ABC-type branched-subunit amino acid transport system ATPase component